MNKFLEWFATIWTISGAFLTAQGNDPWNIYALNLGAALWTVWALRKRLWSIALVNVTLLGIYLYGLFSRMATIWGLDLRALSGIISL